MEDPNKTTPNNKEKPKAGAAEGNNILTNEESSKLDELDWSDITSEINRNRQMLREEAKTNPSGGAGNKSAPPSNTDQIDMQFLHDVSLKMRVEVGNRKVILNEILQYKANSILELDNEVGRKLNIYVNDVLVGFGTIIQKDQKYGIKITDLLNEQQRMEALSAKAFAKD